MYLIFFLSSETHSQWVSTFVVGCLWGGHSESFVSSAIQTDFSEFFILYFKFSCVHSILIQACVYMNYSYFSLHAQNYRMRWLQTFPALLRVCPCSTKRYSSASIHLLLHSPSSSTLSFSSPLPAHGDSWETYQQYTGYTVRGTLLPAWPNSPQCPPLWCGRAYCCHHPDQKQAGHHATIV